MVLGYSQMFGEEQDRGVTEEELECILHTALGVTELRVSRLFRAVDVANSGKVTFGQKTGLFSCLYYLFSQGWSHLSGQS